MQRLTGAQELRKLSCKLSLLNSHATLVLVWPGHESWENYHANSRFSSLINSLMQSWSCLTGAQELRKLSCKLSLLNSHQLSCKLGLVWPGPESWENSRANSIFLALINSHATLVLVWPGHESWENCHANSRFSTLILVWQGVRQFVMLGDFQGPVVQSWYINLTLG
jgi:hypothetical protein